MPQVTINTEEDKERAQELRMLRRSRFSLACIIFGVLGVVACAALLIAMCVVYAGRKSHEVRVVCACVLATWRVVSGQM